jgi:aldehyde:ferredoxin oxidoreductase
VFTATQKVKTMTKAKDEQYEKDLEQFAEWRKEEDDRAKLKEKTMKKLGLTAEEIAALLS